MERPYSSLIARFLKREFGLSAWRHELDFIGFKFDFWLVRVEAEGDERRDNVSKSIERTSVSCMLDLQDIFHLSKDSFNKTSFPQQELVL